MSRKLPLVFSAALSLIFSLFILSFRLTFFSGDAIKPEIADVSRELVLVGSDDGERPATELLPGELIDINTASKEELMLLPGIGDSLSDEIIRYREECAGFSRIEDIMNISGIGEGKFSAMAEHITVNGGCNENTGS